MKNTSRKTRKIIAVILLFVSVAVYIFYSNKAFFSDGGAREKHIDRNDIQYINWEIRNGEYFTGEDSQILLYNINGYVDHLELYFLTDIKPQPQVFYQRKVGESFSEDRSFVSDAVYENSRLIIPIGMAVQGLRIDLTGEANVAVKDFSVKYYTSSFVLAPVKLLCFLFVAGLLLLPVYFPKQTFLNIARYIGGLKRYTYLLSNLVKRDLITKYRRSVLGVLWSILNPFFMMLVITTVFQRLFRFQIEHFPMYYLTGALIFNFVSEATSNSMMSIVAAGPLIRKVYIPKYIFVLEKCIFAFVNMLFAFVATLIMLIILNMQFHWTIFLSFIPMLYTFVFSLGMGLILATLNTFLRDTTHLYSVFIAAWMYLTPIIYPADILPSAIFALVKLNPLYYYVEYMRALVMYGTVPNWDINATCIAFALLFLGLGLFLFKRKQDSFILYL